MLKGTGARLLKPKLVAVFKFWRQDWEEMQVPISL